MTKQARYRLRKHVVFDEHQRLFVDATTWKGYLTVISKNMLTNAPIVIGPVDLNRSQWLSLAEHCRAVADMLSRRTYKREERKEMY